MKKTTISCSRKHGFKARSAAGGERLKTSLVFESSSQVYLWTTDRGRSRLIKH